LIELYPDSSYSSRARAEIVLLDIRSKIAIGTFDPAAGEIEQLKSRYEKDFFLARRCYELGDYCLHNHNYDAAILVLEMVWQQFPEFHYYCGRAKICDDTARICREIKAGNLSESQTALQKFEQDYAGYSYLPGQLYFIAKVYSSYGYQDQYSALCDEMIKIGDSKYAAYGDIHKMRLSIQSHLEADDLAGAKQIFNKFKSRYANSLYLEEGTLDLVREFYDKGLRTEGDSSKDYLKEVIAICQAQEPTEADFKVQSYALLGQSYFRLGNFVESASYYQKLVDEYPDSRFAWNAQFMVGRAYEKMEQAGAMSEQEAVGRIRTAYQNLLEEYPNCKSAKAAQRWLENHN
jgi:outer membrane protein assembly factor BamD (BamD/ComL family)